ncbi:transcription factor S-II, central domain-containing protein [Phycomyces nitens]|nr:transcription factor S-II, central domain-containing protein [Phycomyces nitens]
MRNLTNQGKCLYPPCQNKTRVDSYCSDICARADAMRQKAKDFEYLGEVEESRASQRRSRSTSGTSALEKSSLALGHHKKPSISISTSSSGPNSPIFELQSPNQSATEENPIRKNVVKNMTTILKSIMDTALENEPTLFDSESDQESQDKQTMTEDDDLATKEPAHVTTVALDPTDSGVPESIPVPEITSLEATLNTVATDLIVADGTVPYDNDTQGTTSNTPVPQAEPEQINTDPNTTNIEKSPAKSRSTQTMAEELAQLIEEAMYLQLGDPVSQANKPLKCGEKYKGKFRTLLYNLKDKANKVFQIRVITGELTPDELIKMSSEDMANPELKSMSETLRKKSIKNSVLKVQNIPFIKKTHKGDIIMIPKGENEYGDDSNKAKQLEQEMVMVYQNNERTGEDDVPGTESDVFPDSRKSSISTTPTQARHDPLDDILARIGVSTDGMREDSNKRAGVGLAGSDRNKKRKPTFDVEKLLGDEDIQLEIGSDDEGIITTRRTSDGETVRVDNIEVDQTPKLPSIWKGRVNMPQVAEFEAVARQVGGRPLSDTEWADVLSPTMWIEGRIPQDRVTTYVSQTQYSSSREIILLEIEPSTLLPDAAKEAKDSNLRQSDTLLKYFNSRQRYGVVGHNKTKVKDFYLIPLYKAHDIPDCLYVVRIEESKRDCDLFLGVLILTKQPEQRPLPIPAAYQNHPPYEP